MPENDEIYREHNASGARPVSIHDEAVRTLVRHFPIAKTKGFIKAVNKVMGERFPDGIRPDVFIQDDARQAFICYEVEDHHKIDKTKLERYIRLAWWLSEDDWSLLIITTDRWGICRAAIDPIAYDMKAKGIEIGQAVYAA